MTSTAQFGDIQFLEARVHSSNLPPDLRQKASAALERLSRIANSPNFLTEYDSAARYLDWITNLPWARRSQETLSLENARKILDSSHFGLENIKERVLEYISIAKLQNTQARTSLKSPAFLLLGLVGTGKTTMAYSIALALGRQFGRIPMGGMGDAVALRGRSRVYPDAQPGQIIKVIRRVQTKNPVILLDEIDRVTQEARADMMGVLVELLDPEQNRGFLDHFIDYPFDLSEVLFIATANNTATIATAVLDRLEVLEMPSYSDDQKIEIAKNYLLPREIPANGLSSGDLVFQDDVWSQIVRPLGFDAGMRTLDRTINAICRKVAKLKVEGKKSSVIISRDNLKEYLPQ